MTDRRFEGTDRYVATPDLMLAVNAAITLERPLKIVLDLTCRPIEAVLRPFLKTLKANRLKVAWDITTELAWRPSF